MSVRGVRSRASSGAVFAIVGLLVALSLAGCGSMRRERRDDAVSGTAQTGEASYYAHAFHGRKTASGERFDMWGMTAAHPDLAMGTRVRVTNLANGRAVVVRVNDRGPYHGGRIIDVSYAAARKLGMIDAGVAHVRVEPLSR